ncbi:hypothetical protein GOBAR_AA18334 [Gossypium barbadense]|uniref:Reverse transcriptase domain-containing protein n=1 Tax=Gossypium barbadense TaxID=3634 RepID=A0A2P5XG52_GOSBA|nr:hypothetical protein GOBAR_AA18334 [Gossypium barbadense]
MKPLLVPGPDGFPALFFQECWELIGPNVENVVRDFFDKGKMVMDFNKTFIVLIPKKDLSETANGFRLISLCSTLYKILAKVLEECCTIKGILEQYCRVSGQAINFDKSDMMVSRNCHPVFMKLFQQNLGVKVGHHPSKYLGFPLD